MMTSPTEANLLGNVHGGDVMKLADSTAGAVAHRHSGGPAVTAAMDEMANLFAGARRRHRPHLRPGELGGTVLHGDRRPGGGAAVGERRQREAEIRRAHRLARKAAIDEGRANGG
jgi:hypothetical protein